MWKKKKKIRTLNSSIEKYNLIIIPQSKCIFQVLDIPANYFSQQPCEVTKPIVPGKSGTNWFDLPQVPQSAQIQLPRLWFISESTNGACVLHGWDLACHWSQLNKGTWKCRNKALAFPGDSLV